MDTCGQVAKLVVVPKESGGYVGRVLSKLPTSKNPKVFYVTNLSENLSKIEAFNFLDGFCDAIGLSVRQYVCIPD